MYVHLSLESMVVTVNCIQTKFKNLKNVMIYYNFKVLGFTNQSERHIIEITLEIFQLQRSFRLHSPLQ